MGILSPTYTLDFTTVCSLSGSSNLSICLCLQVTYELPAEATNEPNWVRQFWAGIVGGEHLETAKRPWKTSKQQRLGVESWDYVGIPSIEKVFLVEIQMNSSQVWSLKKTLWKASVRHENSKVPRFVLSKKIHQICQNGLKPWGASLGGQWPMARWRLTRTPG